MHSTRVETQARYTLLHGTDEWTFSKLSERVDLTVPSGMTATPY